MDLTPEIYELIEQYLNGELQGEALQNFEKRLAVEQALAKEVAFQREMHHFLAETPENDLRKTLQMLGDQVVEPKEAEDKGWFWWLWPAAGEANVLDWLLGNPARQLAWILPLLLVAGWWLFSPNSPNPVDPPIVGTDTLKYNKPIEREDTMGTLAVDPSPTLEDTTEKISPIIPKGALKQDPTPVVQQEQIRKPLKVEKKDIPHIESSPIKPTTDDRVMASLPPADSAPKTYPFNTPPIVYWDAAVAEAKTEYFDANIYFDPSKELDSLVEATKLGEEYNIELIANPEVIYLAEHVEWSDTITQKVPLKLVIETATNLFQQDLVLYVKDNQGNPYGPFPLVDKLQLDGTNRYVVQTQIPLWDNTPRLVYYTIEDYNTNEPYFADKVVVLPKDSLFDVKSFPMEKGYSNLADLERRQFEEDQIPDFFAPNPVLEMAIQNNPTTEDLKVIVLPPIPDTIFIPDSLLKYDVTMSDARIAARDAYLDSIFSFQLIVHSTENLFQEGLDYRVVDNIDFSIIRNYDAGFAIRKKYGTNTYFLDFKIGYAGDYPEGLYYYQVSAGSNTFTGKYIILPATNNQ